MATNNRNNTNRPSNYVILTLRAIGDGTSQYAQSGKPWAKVRAFLSQGKDESGEYRPSVFFDVKAFSKDENLGGAVAAIASIANKSYFTVKGRLAMEEWMGKEDGNKHQQLVLIASKIEPFSFDQNEEALDEELEGEPA